MRPVFATKEILTVITAVILAGCLSCGENGGTGPEAPNPYNAELTFEQIDFDVGMYPITNSAWGSVVLKYDGASQILYFNLAVNDRWVIRNVPVMSHEGARKRQSVTFNFDLGVVSGTEVNSLKYAFDLTTDLRTAKPADGKTATVIDRLIIFESGVVGTEPKIEGPGVEFGDRVVRSAKHKGEFPNQDCGEYECTPAAVSNSLKWLKDEHDLKVGEEYGKPIDIKTMKEATAWGKNPFGVGCWINDGEGHNAWWKDKNEYMGRNGYPITTAMITNPDKALTELERGQDVELQGEWHTAAVVGIAKLDDGRWVINVAHDTAQGEAGGTRVEKLICDKHGELEGSPGFFDGSQVVYFVVECPKQ
jgi:hypothetical protein